jgi:hypothetical protein
MNPPVLPWHLKAAEDITDEWEAMTQSDIAAIISRHDPHAAQQQETVRLLEEMILDKTEGPFFHEDEHGPEDILNRARAHLAKLKETSG